jgi:hypothetical protein
MRVFLGRGAARCEQRNPGRDEERPVGAFERGAQRFDGLPVHLAVLLEFREVVVEGGVDHAIGLSRATAQAFQISHIAAMDSGAESGDGRGCLIRARQAEDFVSCANQFFDDGRADKAARAGNEDTHEKILRVDVDLTLTWR